MDKPWYVNGLRFTCTQCGACCAGKPRGHVVVTDDDLDRIEAQTGKRLATRQSIGEQVLVLTKTGDCPLLKRCRRGKRACLIYNCQLEGCKPAWPFVPELLDVPAAWVFASETCPGMNRGRLYTLPEIRAMLRWRS